MLNVLHSLFVLGRINDQPKTFSQLSLIFFLDILQVKSEFASETNSHRNRGGRGQNAYCSRDIYLQWRKYYRSDTVFLEMRTKIKHLLRTDCSESEIGKFPAMLIAVLRLSGDESLVF